VDGINLRLRDLDHIRQTIWLREKLGTEREQPISRSLLQAVTDIAAARGSTDLDHHALVTLHRAGNSMAPVTDRTYDRIFTTVQKRVCWRSERRSRPTSSAIPQSRQSSGSPGSRRATVRGT
jgi:hypothetical protein